MLGVRGDDGGESTWELRSPRVATDAWTKTGALLAPGTTTVGCLSRSTSSSWQQNGAISGRRVGCLWWVLLLLVLCCRLVVLLLSAAGPLSPNHALDVR